MTTKPTGKAIGGVARAKALSSEQLKEIATKGGTARWSNDVEIAKSFGEMQIADTSIPCAVLEDGTRMLSERAITKAFGGKRGGSHWKRLKTMAESAYLPVFLSAGNIKPFINQDLEDSLARRRLYRPKKGGTAAYGIEASLLPKICNVYLNMRDSGDALTASQVPLATQADLLMRGLAEVGITALVDEATGYIHEKKKDEYRVSVWARHLYIACVERNHSTHETRLWTLWKPREWQSAIMAPNSRQIFLQPADNLVPPLLQ